MVKYEWGLGCAADAVEGLEMRAGKHDGVAVRKDKGPLQQAALLHAGNRMRQLDVVHIDELMPREQSDAVMASTEYDGGPEQPFHAALVGQLGDEIAVVLMRTIGAMGVLIHLLQSDEIGLVLPNELPYLLQTGIMAGMEIKRHDRNGIGVALSKGHTGQQPC